MKLGEPLERGIVLLLLSALLTSAAAFLAFRAPNPVQQSTAAVQVHSDSFPCLDLVTSPDGKTMAFSSNRSGSFDIWIMNIDGRHLTRLTYLKGDERWPTFDPAGRLVAFVNSVQGSSDLYVVDTASLRSSLVDRHSVIGPPAWSPDGRRLAYSVSDGGKAVIYLLSIDTDVKEVISVPSVNCSDPSWSPDSTKIAFTAYNESTSHIWTYDCSNKRVLQVTRDNGLQKWPKFGKDQNEIAYLCDSSGSWSVWIELLNESRSYDALVPSAELPLSQLQPPSLQSDSKFEWGFNYTSVLIFTGTTASQDQILVAEFGKKIFTEVGESTLWFDGPLVTAVSVGDGVNVLSCTWGPRSNQILASVQDGDAFRVLLLPYVSVAPVPRGYG
jgi:dipeptidyl aminopeptidase/acylaminoacyl peptidase